MHFVRSLVFVFVVVFLAIVPLAELDAVFKMNSNHIDHLALYGGQIGTFKCLSIKDGFAIFSDWNGRLHLIQLTKAETGYVVKGQVYKLESSNYRFDPRLHLHRV